MPHRECDRAGCRPRMWNRGDIVRSSRWTVVVAAGVLLALSGCTPAAEGGPTSTASPRPTASSSPTAVTTPAPACADLAEPGQITALVGGSGAPQTFDHLQSGGIVWDAAWSTWTANGAVCGWGERGVDWVPEQAGPGTVLVQVAPGLESAWNSLAQELHPSAGSPYDGGVSLGGGRTDGGLCQTDVLVDGAWLHVQAQGEGALSESAFHAFVQGVVTRYRALPAPTVRQPRPRSCDDPGLREAVKGVFGEEGVLADGSPAFALGEGLFRAGYLTSCRFDATAEGERWETFVTVLDNAPPSLVAEYRARTDHPESVPVDVATLGGDSSGLFEPTVDSQRTIVDVARDGRWIEVVTYETSDTAKTVALTQALLASSWVK